MKQTRSSQAGGRSTGGVDRLARSRARGAGSRCLGERRRERSAHQSPDDNAQHVHERGWCARAAGRRGREDQAHDPRHARRRDLGRRSFRPGSSPSSSRARTEARRSRPSPHRPSSAGRLKPPSPTGCSPTPTKPTTRIRRRSRIPDVRSCRPRWRSARRTASTACASCAPWRWATTSARASPPRSASSSTWRRATAARTRSRGRSARPRPRAAPPA